MTTPSVARISSLHARAAPVGNAVLLSAELHSLLLFHAPSLWLSECRLLDSE